MPWCASGRPSRPPSPRSICRLRAGWPAGATGQWPPACARSRPCPRKFTATAPAQHAVVTVAASLAGTHSLARPAGPGRADFAKAAREAVPALRAADLSATVVTMQGPIRLADYLITRCVEAVVHGCGPAGPARPDRAAQAITAGALPEALAAPGSPPRAGGPAAAVARLDRCRDRTAAGPGEPGSSSPRDDLSGKGGPRDGASLSA